MSISAENVGLSLFTLGILAILYVCVSSPDSIFKGLKNTPGDVPNSVRLTGHSTSHQEPPSLLRLFVL